MRISYSQISEMTGKSYRTIKKSLDDAGITPLEQSGRKILFDSQTVLEALYSQKNTGDGADVDANYHDLLHQEKWREKKRENDIADDLIAPVEILTDALRRVGLQMVAHLEALPLEMKRANPKLTGHDFMTVKKSIHKCCDAISRIQLADDD